MIYRFEEYATKSILVALLENWSLLRNVKNVYADEARRREIRKNATIGYFVTIALVILGIIGLCSPLRNNHFWKGLFEGLFASGLMVGLFCCVRPMFLT